LCFHSDEEPENNLCDKAHSQDELEEWIQRARYRKEKMRMAQRVEHDAFKYIDQLREDLQRLSEEEVVSNICENINQQLSHCHQE